MAWCDDGYRVYLNRRNLDTLVTSCPNESDAFPISSQNEKFLQSPGMVVTKMRKMNIYSHTEKVISVSTISRFRTVPPEKLSSIMNCTTLRNLSEDFGITYAATIFSSTMRTQALRGTVALSSLE